MVSVLTSSAVDRWFEFLSGNICICCFSAKQAALRGKSKDWLAQYQNNVSVWSDMSILGLFLQCASIITIQLSVLIYSKADIIISLKINLFSP